MARKRFNNLTSTVGSGGLTGSATTIPFPSKLTYDGGDVPTLAAGEYIPLSIGTEIVWLTAYTTGATSGTIARGKEGTTGVSHAAGDKVTHGPTVVDVAGFDSNDSSHLIGTNLTKQGIVLTTGTAGAWDETYVESPTVMYDPKSGKWAMVYTGYGSTSGAQRAGIGLAFSDDGINWTKSGSAAILPHSGVGGALDQNGCTGPVLLWDNDNGQYVLYYIGLTSTGYESGTKTICYATATSLTGPWTRQGAAVSTGTGWRSNAVWHASIVKRDQWYMFFNATNGSGVETIGYATAPSITGPWTVDDANSPVISTGTGWEAGIVGDPCVRRIGDMWVMTYFGTTAGQTAAFDGIAVTPDSSFPLGWTKYANNPVLSPSETYDAKSAHKPFVIQKGGVLFHYYTAINASDARQIALATEGLPEPGAPGEPGASNTTALVPLVSQLGAGDFDLVWTDAGELIFVEVSL